MHDRQTACTSKGVFVLEAICLTIRRSADRALLALMAARIRVRSTASAGRPSDQ